jgi:hypothetical protein
VGSNPAVAIDVKGCLNGDQAGLRIRMVLSADTVVDPRDGLSSCRHTGATVAPVCLRWCLPDHERVGSQCHEDAGRPEAMKVPLAEPTSKVEEVRAELVNGRLSDGKRKECRSSSREYD